MNPLTHKFVWAVFAFLLAMAVIVAAVSWYASEKVIHPSLDPSLDPEKYGLLLEEVRFQSRDGFRLAGWFLRGSNGATIILAHGRGSDHTHMLPEAKLLHDSGFSVFLFDFRYRGKSEGEMQTIGAKESWDIESALDYLSNRPDIDPFQIAVHGNSMGAIAAIMAAAERQEIRGVIAEIPFSSLNHMLHHSFKQVFDLPSFPFAILTKWTCEMRLGIDLDQLAPIKVIGRISPRPVFLIDDEKDELFPHDSVERLYSSAREPKEYWLVPGCPHGQARECEPEEYPRRVIAFWEKALEISR